MGEEQSSTGCEESKMVFGSSDFPSGIPEPDLMAAVQQQTELILDSDSFAASLIDETTTPESRAVELLMAMRETGLLIQSETVEVDRDKKVEVPIWVVVALFKSVLKRLR